MSLIRKFATVTEFCKNAGIEQIRRYKQGRSYLVYPFSKKQKKWLQFLFTFLRMDADALLLANYYKTWEAFRTVFWDDRNFLLTLDNFALTQIVRNKASCNIVITGVGALTGAGKSWSGIALSLRWSPINGDGLIKYSPKHIFMSESKMNTNETWIPQGFYNLDDPQLARVGTGIQQLKQRLENFMRIASRYGQISLITTSAVDLFTGRATAKSLQMDGVHFYLEIWGYNIDNKHALGMAYDRNLNPLGWTLVPSPLLSSLYYWDDVKKSWFYRKDFSCIDLHASKQEKKIWSLEELITHYESVLKRDYVQQELSQISTDPEVNDKIQVLLKHPRIDDFSNNLSELKTLIRSVYKSITQDQTDDLARFTMKELEKVRPFILLEPKQKRSKEKISAKPIESNGFLFKVEKVFNTPIEYYESMFSDEAKIHVLKISRTYATLIDESWDLLKYHYVDGLSYRDMESSGYVPMGISKMSNLINAARDSFIGYCDEFAYHIHNPDLEWIGGNTAGTADFLDKDQKLVISKKFRQDKHWCPAAEDLSRDEKLHIKDGWSGKLDLTIGNTRRTKIFSISQNQKRRKKNS